MRPSRLHAAGAVRWYAAALFLTAAAGPGTLQASPFYLYGGPSSLDGRFETAAGDVDEQGWFGVQSTDEDEIWQVSDFNAANLAGHGPGNHAVWAGRSAVQEPEWVNAPGYGNDFWTRLEWAASVGDPASPVTVGLEFYYNYDTEPGYDHLLVEWLAGDEWRQLLAVSGTNRSSGVFPSPGEHLDQSWTIQPDELSGLPADQVRLRLAVFSDSGVSDQDGILLPGGETDGAAQIDDILVTFDGVPVDGGGDADGLATFENGDTEGWASVGATCRCSLWSALPEAYAGAATNPTPVLAQVTDASVGLVSLSCDFWSPEIPWGVPEPTDGALLILDVFATTSSRSGPSWYRLSVASKVAGMFGSYDQVLLGTPHVGWQRIEVDLTGTVPDDAESIRLRMSSQPQGYTNVIAFDNVTVVRYDTATGAIPISTRASASIERVYPNPANPSAAVDFRTALPGAVRLTVYDVRGRRVRTLVDEALPAGSHTVQFDGRDARSAALASGVYFLQLETPMAAIARRLTLVE